MIENNGGYLGMYQAGAMVPLRLACCDRDTNAVVLPDRAPWLRVHGASGAVANGNAIMPMEDATGLPGLFKVPLRLGPLYPEGPYFVIYTYIVGGRTYMLRDQFEVVGGSDSSGTVISLYSYHHPESNYVFAQLTSRRVVMGRNPKV